MVGHRNDFLAFPRCGGNFYPNSKAVEKPYSQNNTSIYLVTLFNFGKVSWEHRVAHITTFLVVDSGSFPLNTHVNTENDVDKNQSLFRHGLTVSPF